MWVVKLGGSLAYTGQLPVWLEVLASKCSRDVIVVPGGGPFADQVRTAQLRWGFSDLAAHRMAVLAMEQYGMMLRAMCPELAPVATASQLIRSSGLSSARIWLPARLVLAEPSLPASWAVTSDSLAAWLARRVHADHVVLIKSVHVVGPSVRCDELQARGILDEAFGAFYEGVDFTTWLCESSNPGQLRRALCTGTNPGVRIVPNSTCPATAMHRGTC